MIFSSNAITLIESLQKKIKEGKSEIWTNLVEIRGMSIEKLLDMKKKAYNAIGKAEKGRKNYKEAVDGFASVLTTIDKILALPNVDASKYAPNIAEANKSLAQARQLLQGQVNKEKSVWSKAFKENAILPDNTVDSTVNSATARDSSSGDNSGKDNTAVEEKAEWSTYLTGMALVSLGVGVIAGAAFLLARSRRGR